MLTLSDNPPLTYPVDGTLSEAPGSWKVVYTKPRQEKALAWDLYRLEIPYFLPMVIRETSSGGRRRRNWYPLFPSYLFFAGGEEERLKALKTERTVQLIDVDEFQYDQFCEEISNLEIALREEPESIELYPRLVEGARARVRLTAFKNVEGVILESDSKKKKLLLSISLLGVGATLEIHSDLVDPS